MKTKRFHSFRGIILWVSLLGLTQVSWADTDGPERATLGATAEASCADRPMVNPLAGPLDETPKPGYVDGPAWLARFNTPTGLAAYLDPRTLMPWLYVADSGNHVIRLIKNGDGVVTVAGVPGVAGFQDGPAYKALFHHPTGLALDATSGMLYVVDTGNHAIRRIAPDGQVTTLAGTGTPGYADGPGAAALFNRPRSATVGYDGSEPRLFVADTGNHCVRAINLDNLSPTVSTAAGLCTQPGYNDGRAKDAKFLEPRSLDWWALFEAEPDQTGQVRPRYVDRGFLFIADDTGVRIVQDQMVSTIPIAGGVQSVFSDARYNLYITTPSNSVQEIRSRGQGMYDPPKPLIPCGPGWASAFGVATYFGAVAVADPAQHAIRAIRGPIVAGPSGQCLRCGPQTQPSTR